MMSIEHEADKLAHGDSLQLSSLGDVYNIPNKRGKKEKLQLAGVKEMKIIRF